MQIYAKKMQIILLPKAADEKCNKWESTLLFLTSVFPWIVFAIGDKFCSDTINEEQTDKICMFYFLYRNADCLPTTSSFTSLFGIKFYAHLHVTPKDGCSTIFQPQILLTKQISSKAAPLNVIIFATAIWNFKLFTDAPSV